MAKIIFGQLDLQWKKHLKSGTPLVLEGRYEVVEVNEISHDNAHSCHLATALDLQNDRQRVTVPITQAALKFSERLLRGKQIQHANALLEQHLVERDKCCVATEGGRSDAMIISYAGIGGNAALITYRVGLACIDKGLSENQLEGTLEKIVMEGRRCRNPRFLHSAAQLDEVKDVLALEISRRITSLPGNPRARPLGVNHAMVEKEKSPETPIAATVHQALPFSAGAGAPNADRRRQVLACIDNHLGDSPLRFCDALVADDIEAACFCAVQSRRMRTPTTEFGQYPGIRRSLHAAIDVVEPVPEDVVLEPKILFGKDGRAVYPELADRRDIRFTDVLRADLSQATMARSDRVAGTQQDGSLLFPNGLAVALESGREVRSPAHSVVTRKLNGADIVDFSGQRREATTCDLVADLAVHNPSAVALVHYLDHALLI